MSKRMIRLVALSVSMLMVMLAFAGCGGAANDKTENVGNETAATDVEKTAASKGSSEKITMKFWVRDAAKKSVTSSLVDRYNEENEDNVYLEYEIYGENYKNVIQMSMAAGNPPDIFDLNGGLTIPQLAAADYILPIDKYVDDDYKNDFYPDVLQQKSFYYKGSLYALPERAVFFRLVYNKELFEKCGIAGPPETLEEMKEIAKKITDMGKGEFYGFASPLKTSSTWGRFCDNISALNGNTAEYGFDWKTGAFDFTKQKKALEFLMSLEQEKIMMPGCINLDLEVGRVQFGAGKIAMWIDGNNLGGIFNTNQVQCDVDWDTAPIPVFEGDQRGKYYVLYDIARLMSKATKYPDQAWSFLKYLHDNQNEYIKESARTTIVNNDPSKVPSEFKGTKEFYNMDANKAFPVQVHTFLTVEGDNRDATYANIFTGGLDIDKGLKELTERYNAALNKVLESGELTKEDINISGFDYFTR